MNFVDELESSSSSTLKSWGDNVFGSSLIAKLNSEKGCYLMNKKVADMLHKRVDNPIHKKIFPMLLNC